MENAIILSRDLPTDITAVLSDNAILAKSKIVDLLQSFAVIETDEQAAEAALQMKAAKKLCKEVDEARKVVVAPLRAIAEDAMTRKKAFVDDIEVETKRLSGVIGTFERIKREKAEKINREEQEKLRKEQERIQKEADDRAKKEKEASDKEIAKAKEANDKKRENELRLEKHNQAAKIEAEAKEELKKVKSVAKAEIATSKPAKTVTLRKEWKFEVTDINMLQMMNPDLVTLSANTLEIKKKIKDGQPVPGLKIWSEDKAI